jgi:hypothetical protein
MPDVISEVKEYIALSEKRNELRKKEREIKQQMDEIEAQVIDDMTHQGVSSLDVDGKRAYLSTTLRARSKDGDHVRAVRALLDNGLDDLITLGPQKTSSYFRKFDDPEEIPPDLREAFEIYEQTSVNVRKS